MCSDIVGSARKARRTIDNVVLAEGCDTAMVSSQGLDFSGKMKARSPLTR